MSETLVEFTVIGHSVKVTAIDSETGIEATIIGAASVPKDQLAQLAARKLAYVMDKRKKT